MRKNIHKTPKTFPQGLTGCLSGGGVEMNNRRMTALFVAAAALLAGRLCASCTTSENIPDPQWNIGGFRSFDESSGCCATPAATVFGVAAVGIPPTDRISLKIAAGCRPYGNAFEATALVELRQMDESGASERFTGTGITHFYDCADAFVNASAAVFEALDSASDLAGIAAMPDSGLCSILKDQKARRVLVGRTLEEIGSRRITACMNAVRDLAAGRDTDIALRAIGTIGRVGTPSEFDILGRLTLSNDTQIPWAAVHAIADIGGPEAGRALDIVAGQANTEELRRAALELAEKVASKRK